MKRTTAAAIGLVVILACIAARPSDAAKPSAAPRLWINVIQAVEQQGGIQNRTGCAWDVDDRLGYLTSGSGSWSFCIVGDWGPHLVYAQNATVTLAGVTGSCLIGPDYDHAALLPAIGEGVGIIHDVTVTSTARKRAGVGYGVAPTFLMDSLCPGSGWVRLGEYPGPFVAVQLP